MARPWERYSRDRGGVPSVQTRLPPRPAPQTAPQAQGDVLRNTRTEQEIQFAPQVEQRAQADQARQQQQFARIPDAAARDFTTDIDAFAGLRRAVEGFNDDFAGWGSGVENTAQGYLGTGTPGQRDWWSDFYMADNVARNRLFGASLSEGEQAAFARTTVSPNMSPAQVRENLNRRLELARDALRRRTDFLRAQGYDNTAIGALLGGNLQALQPRQQQTPAPGIGVEQMTALPPQAAPLGSGGEMQLNTTERTTTSPVFAGVNAQMEQFVRRGASPRDVAGWLRERGLQPNDIAAIMPQYNRLRTFLRQNPNYRGPLTIDLERFNERLDPISSVGAMIADSPVGAAAVAGGDIATGGHLDNIVGAVGGDAELANLGIRQLRERHPIASIVGDISGGGALYGAGRGALQAALRRGVAPATGTFAPGAIAGDAAMGAYIGSGQGGTELLNPYGAATGALFGAGGGVVGRGAINTAARAVSPTGGALAPLYREGVQPTIGQRIGGAMDRVEQAFTSVPIAGGVQRSARSASRDEFQRGAFNQSLRDIGLQLPGRVGAGKERGASSAHLFTQRAFDREFRQVRAQARFVPDNEFGQRFGQILQDVDTLPDQSAGIFRRLVQGDFAKRLRAGGNTLTGDPYIRVVSRIDRVARNQRNSANGDAQLAEVLEGLSEAIDEAAARNSAPGMADRLRRARTGYRKLVVIEDAARRRGTGGGEFSPTQFDAAVQNIGGGLRSRAYLRGQAPMQEYAEAGLRLGDDLPNSGTTDRWMSIGAPFVLGGVGLGHVPPVVLAPWAASTAATLPGVRQGINAMIAPNRLNLNPYRRQIEERAYLGSLAGVPLIPQE